MITFLIPSCEKISNNNAENEETKKLTQKASGLAITEGIDKFLRHCGDYWYLKYKFSIDTLEYKRFKKHKALIKTSVPPLLESDKLNGIECRVFVAYEIYNLAYQYGEIKKGKWSGWSEWREDPETMQRGEPESIRLWVIKKKGKWIVEDPLPVADSLLRSKITCEETEKLQ